jgi:hypothetical protein
LLPTFLFSVILYIDNKVFPLKMVVCTSTGEYPAIATKEKKSGTEKRGTKGGPGGKVGA